MGISRVPSYRQIIFSVFVICMMIFSLINNVVLVVGHAYSLYSADEATYDLIEIDLSSIGENVTPYKVIVTILNGSKEVEVPFISKPVGIYSSKFVLDTLYNGRRVTSLTYSEYIRLINESINNRLDRNLVKPIVTQMTYLTRKANSSRIVVFLPEKIMPNKIISYKSWYRYALISGLTKRAIYKYKDYIIFVYYNRILKHPIDREILFPQDLPNTVINPVVRIGDRYSRRYVIDTCGLSTKMHPMANFISIEEYNGRDIESTWSSQYRIIWYNRPWRSQGKDKGKITLGVLNNRTLNGRYYYYLSDSLTVRYNTTRYETWFWISTDKPVSGYLWVTLGTGSPVYWQLSMVPGVLYGYSIIVHTIPEEPGNYLTPEELDVRLLIYVNDPTAKIVLISHVLAKAYISNTAKGFYVSRINLKGIGKLQELSSWQNTLDERYDLILRGEALFGFIPINTYVESEAYPILRVFVQSSSEQKYDRLVQLYVNGLLIDQKVAKNPYVPNGTRGRRSCIFTVHGDEIMDEIIASMKYGTAPLIRVVIKGFQSPDESGTPQEEWFVYGSMYYYMRAPCIKPYDEINNNILYMEDPTVRYNGSACHYLGFIPIFNYNGMQMDSGNTDIMEKYFQITVFPGLRNNGDFMKIWVAFNPTSGWKMDSNTGGMAFTRHFELTMELHSPISILDAGHSAYGPGNDKIRKLLESIQWGLWVTGMAVATLSLVSGNWVVSGMSLLVTALSCPSLYIHGSYTFSEAKHGYNNKVMILTIKWDSGWTSYMVAPITGYFDIEPKGNWPNDGTFTLYYEYDVHIEYMDKIGPTWYDRLGAYSDYGYICFNNYPPG